MFIVTPAARSGVDDGVVVAMRGYRSRRIHRGTTRGVALGMLRRAVQGISGNKLSKSKT